MADRCYISEGVLIPGCWGAAIRGASGCDCTPRPRGIKTLAAAEDRAEAEEARSDALRREAVASATADAAAKWRATGGRPQIVKASNDEED